MLRLLKVAVRDLVVSKHVELDRLALDHFQEELSVELISPICAIDMSIKDHLAGLVRRWKIIESRHIEN